MNSSSPTIDSVVNTLERPRSRSSVWVSLSLSLSLLALASLLLRGALRIWSLESPDMLVVVDRRP